jgi:hypothetical protein
MKGFAITPLIIFIFMLTTSFPCLGQDENITIHGCYKKNNGQLRIVDDPSECNPSEISMFWNQAGPQGPQGEAGTDGQDGLDGLSCWDLNGNYIQDEEEDINGDGFWDTNDCVPTQATTASVLQTRVYSDYTRRITSKGGHYYFGGSEFSNSITPTKSDSIILISINYFGETNNVNMYARLQYSINSGVWYNFDLTGLGQQGTLTLSSYPDNDFNSTPHNYSTQIAKSFGTTETISFRMFHICSGSGSFYHNSAVNPSYESGPSTLVLQELNAQNSSYIKR